jgi:mannose-6-phosphate isomerase-like protein (cupin superfamily)
MRIRPFIGLALPLLLIASLAHTQDKGTLPGGKTTGPKTHAGRPPDAPRQVEPYTENVFRLTETNTNYRKVLFTGARSQLVAMSLPPGESIGRERHDRVEQTLVILSGSGEAVLDGKRTGVGRGDVIVVTPGTEHDLVNTGSAPLKLFTTYTPPNHIDGRVHRTKQDAERDVENERFGHEVE